MVMIKDNGSGDDYEDGDDIRLIKNDPIWQVNEAKMKIPKNSEWIPFNPGIINIGKSRLEKSRDPGIW